MLTETEWCTINHILLNLYAVNELDLLTKEVLKIIKMLIPYTKGWFLLLDEEQEIVEENSYFNGFNENAKKDYIYKYYNEDYIQYLYSFESDTNVYRDTNILEKDIRTNTTFYKSFLQPEDIVYGCGILIARNGKNTAVFNLFRSEQLGDFTDKELYILDILKKHLENMVYNVTQISRANKTVKKSLNTFSKKFNLTSRENEIMSLINKGYSNQEIADELVISLSTVKKHIYNLYAKTGVSSRSQLISLFLN